MGWDRMGCGYLLLMRMRGTSDISGPATTAAAEAGGVEYAGGGVGR